MIWKVSKIHSLSGFTLFLWNLPADCSHLCIDWFYYKLAIEVLQNINMGKCRARLLHEHLCKVKMLFESSACLQVDILFGTLKKVWWKWFLGYTYHFSIGMGSSIIYYIWALILAQSLVVYVWHLEGSGALGHVTWHVDCHMNLYPGTMR